MHRIANLGDQRAADLDLQILANGDGQVLADLFIQRTADRLVQLGVVFGKVCVADGYMLVVADEGATLVQHAQVGVFFRPQKDLLAAFFVFDANLVVTAATRGRQSFQYGAGFVLWQRIGRLTLAVVDPSDHDWAIRIAVFEFDNYFLANPGN